MIRDFPRSFGGRPVATAIAELGPRRRLVATGTIASRSIRQWAGVPVQAYEFDDGTGTVVLAFTGKRERLGLAVGRRCVVEGTATPDPHGPALVLWNPGYELLE